VEKLYINGRQQAETVELPSDGIIGFGPRRTPITRIAYSFFYIFPVSLILALYKRADPVSGRPVLPVVVAMGLTLASESFQALAFNKSIDVSLLIGGTIIALLGALSGQILSVIQQADPDSFRGLRRP
jgi:hypothetical protein